MASDTPASDSFLFGRVALVTGGARGLGVEIGHEFAALDIHVIVGARDQQKA
jgi:NAD(P)-dependent dehydrogenase (short-subunit alcohol dehydrogenase family)